MRNTKTQKKTDKTKKNSPHRPTPEQRTLPQAQPQPQPPPPPQQQIKREVQT